MTLAKLLRTGALCGALFVGAVSCALAAFDGEIPAGNFWGNPSASAKAPGKATGTAMFDRAFCATNNAVLARISGSWACLSPANNAIFATSASGVPAFSALTSLPHKTTPTPSDVLLIADQAASGALKYSLISEAVAAVSSGVVSIAGNTGAFTLSNGICNTANDVRLCTIGANTVLGNFTGGAAVPTAQSTTGTGSVMRANAPTMAGNLILNGNWLSGDGGNEGIQVDSSGNVGVGTSSPIFDGNSAIARYLSVNNATAHNFSEIGIGGNATSAGDYLGSIGFYNSSLGAADKRTAIIFGQTEGATNSGNLQFYTYNAGTLGERLRISPTGNVGIANASPPSLLSVGTNFFVDASGSHKTSSAGVAVNSATITTSGDQSANLIAALAAYDVVQLPCGTFSFNSTPVQPATQTLFPRSGQTLAGSGKCTILKNTLNDSAYRGLLQIDNVNDITIRDLVIDLDGKGTTAFCINAMRSDYPRILNVGCKNGLNTGFLLSQNGGSDGSDYALISGCHMENLGNVASTNSHAIEVSLSHHVNIIGCVMKNVDNGINYASSNFGVVSGVTINGSGLTNSAFGGVRCSGSKFMQVSGVVTESTPTGLRLNGCQSSSFSGITIRATKYAGIFLEANNLGGGGPDAMTLGNTLTGIAIDSPCTAGACAAAVSFELSGVPANYVTNNTISGVNLVSGGGSPSALYGLVGVTAGINKCDTSVTTMSNVSYGSC